MGRLFANKEFYEICNMTEEETVHSAVDSEPMTCPETAIYSCRICQVSFYHYVT